MKINWKKLPIVILLGIIGTIFMIPFFLGSFLRYPFLKTSHILKNFSKNDRTKLHTLHLTQLEGGKKKK